MIIGYTNKNSVEYDKENHAIYCNGIAIYGVTSVMMAFDKAKRNIKGFKTLKELYKE